MRQRAKKHLHRLRQRYAYTGSPQVLDEIRALYRFVSGPAKRADRQTDRDVFVQLRRGAVHGWLGASTGGAS